MVEEPATQPPLHPILGVENSTDLGPPPVSLVAEHDIKHRPHPRRQIQHMTRIIHQHR